MTQIAVKTTVCGCCGKERKELELLSTNIYEGSDLDFRPGKMYRDTMRTWLQECTNCHYIAEDLADGKPGEQTYFQELYNINDIILQNELATRFYKYGLWNLHKKRLVKAYYAFLHAAWVFDDERNKDAAISCRKKAISLFSLIIEEKSIDEEIVLVQADMLRRVSKFSKVKELLENFCFHSTDHQVISDYQMMLCEQKDTGCFKEIEAQTYAKKKISDWKENGTLWDKEQLVKNEIKERLYSGTTLAEEFQFDRSFELVKKIEEFMQCFYEQYRTTENLIKYIKLINNTRDYSFFSVQDVYFKQWLEETFSICDKKEVIRVALEIVEHMKRGEKVTEEVSPVDENTQKFINLLDEILKDDNPKLTTEERNIKEVLYEYERALTLLDQYDHQNMVRPVGHKATKSIDYQECKKAIDYMKEQSFPTSELFGKEKDGSFKGAIATIEQTYNAEEVYSSVEEKAAHLLYFATKNHGFYDGNKRIAAAMFLYYLNKNDRLFLWGGKKAIEDSAVAALTVMIAESRPEEKDMMIDMVMNCLCQ